MQTVPLATVKAQLSALVDAVEDTHERVVITRNGRPAAVLLSPEDLEGLEETLDVLADPRRVARLAQAEAELDRGEGLDEAQLRDLLRRPGTEG